MGASEAEVAAVLRDYPRIFFACHRRHVFDADKGVTLSAHQASVLSHLDQSEAMPLFDLARHMGVTASTMSLTVDRLERGGYVTRERNKQDKRCLDLRLTADGARVKGQEKVLEPELVTRLLGYLDEQRAEALRGLELLAEAASKMIAAGDTKRYWRGEKP